MSGHMQVKRQPRLAPRTLAGASPDDPGTRRPELDLLASVPLFAGLSRAHRRRVGVVTEDAAYHAGRVIVKRDDPGRAFYVIVDGLAKVVRGKIVTARAKRSWGPATSSVSSRSWMAADGRRPWSPPSR